MITKTKVSPSVDARPRVLVGASIAGGVTCAATANWINGTGMSVDASDALGLRPTYVPTLQAFHVGDRAWSPPV